MHYWQCRRKRNEKSTNYGEQQKKCCPHDDRYGDNDIFAAGHIAAGNTGIVLYDVATVFIDSLIFSVIYHKSGNCVISTFSHILGNAISLVAVFLFF